MNTAKSEAVAHIVAMARRFHAHNNPPWPWSEPDMSATVSALIDSPAAYVKTTQGGFIIGIMQENPISRSWLIAKEFLWWAEDGNGATLLRGFKQWAKDGGASEIHLSCPASNKRVQRIYGRNGTATEIVYSEVLQCA